MSKENRHLKRFVLVRKRLFPDSRLKFEVLSRVATVLT